MKHFLARGQGVERREKWSRAVTLRWARHFNEAAASEAAEGPTNLKLQEAFAQLLQ